MRTCLFVATLAAFAITSTMEVHAAQVCKDNLLGPLPDCVKILNRGGGKYKLQNHCEYDVSVIVDRSVEFDDREYVKAGHEKNIVSRLAIKTFCCLSETPECATAESTP